MKTPKVLVAVIFSAIPGVAFAQSSSTKNMDMKASPATQAYMREMEGMHDKMLAITPTNDPSKDFVMMMKPHHQAAVEMAQTYLKYGTDPQLKKMAQDIVTSQAKEIKQMDAWQAKHGM